MAQFKLLDQMGIGVHKTLYQAFLPLLRLLSFGCTVYRLPLGFLIPLASIVFSPPPLVLRSEMRPLSHPLQSTLHHLPLSNRPRAPLSLSHLQLYPSPSLYPLFHLSLCNTIHYFSSFSLTPSFPSVDLPPAIPSLRGSVLGISIHRTTEHRALFK